MVERTVQGKNMNSMARFLILTVTVLVFGTGLAFAQVADMPIRGCPVGGYALISCPIVNDEVIHDVVAMRLRGIAASPGTHVEICVQNGVVILSGVVADQSRREFAGLLAASVPGVVQVENRIALLPAAQRDLALIREVRQALSRAPIGLRQVTVEVSEGIVRLSGIVDTDFAREQAVLIASSIRGVVAVQNNLITRRIGEAF